MVSDLKKRTKGKSDNEKPRPVTPTTAEPQPETDTAQQNENTAAPLRYGRMPTFSGQRLWSRAALIIGLMAVVYFNNRNQVKESALAKYDETIQGRAFDTKCPDDYFEAVKPFKGCQPAKCGRIVADLLEPTTEFFLSQAASRVFAYSKGNAGIYDVFTGKLIHDQETDLVLENGGDSNKVFKVTDREYLQSTASSVHQMIVKHFGVETKIRLNTAFYTKMTTKGKKREHLSQLLVHQTFSHFSAIIYLSDQGKDFSGGRLSFPDSDQTNRTVEGRKGRVLSFTSGTDNQHRIEPVTQGGLITLVLGFTCNPNEKTGTLKLP